MGMKEAGADLFLNGGLLNGTRRIGAYWTATLELSGRNYSDVGIALSGWRRIGSTGWYENSAAVNFPRPNAAWLAISHWALKASNGATILLTDPIDSGGASAGIGSPVAFQSGALEVGFEGNVTAAGSVQGLVRGLLAGTRKLSVHSGNPSNPTHLRLGGAIDITASQFTNATLAADATAGFPKRRAAENNVNLVFGISSVDHPRPVYVAISDGAGSSNNILWKDEFDDQVVDPVQYDVFTFGAKQLQIPITVD